MELWKCTFHDSDTFIRFYFDRKYRDDRSLLHEENGKALSAFLMLPYPMNWQGISLNTAYISGACTREEARNQGYMSSLLKKAFQQMYKSNIALSTLIPAEEWLFEYYGKLGYATIFDYTTEIYETDTQSPVDTTFSIRCPANYDPDFAESVFPYFEQKTQSRSCCIQHPASDYQAVIEEAYLSGGRLAAIYDSHSGTLQGWALAVPEEGVVRIKECFCDTLPARKNLLHYFSRLWQISRLEYRSLPKKSNCRHFGMARITHAGIMLQRIAHLHPSLSVSITLHDPYLPENEGTYVLSRGKCEKEKKTRTQTVLETDVPTLTQTLLGYHSGQPIPELAELIGTQLPFMNLMME